MYILKNVYGRLQRKFTYNSYSELKQLEKSKLNLKSIFSKQGNSAIKQNVYFWCTGQKAIFLSLLFAFIISVFMAVQIQEQKAFAETCAQIRQQSLRLHVKANSDSIDDQTLKLKVRDASLALMQELYASEQPQTKQSAIELFAKNIARFQITAQDVVAKNGSNLTVNVYFTNEFFYTTEYETFTLPAGEYTALRIDIGEHKGENWWCVLYPEFCLAAAGEGYETPKENEIIVGDYAVRFAVLDWWEEQKYNDLSQ